MQIVQMTDKTICLLKDRFSGKIFVGKSKCHPDDSFQPDVGITIAFNRAKRKEILYNIKETKKQLKQATNLLDTTCFKITHLRKVLDSLDEQLKTCQEK